MHDQQDSGVTDKLAGEFGEEENTNAIMLRWDATSKFLRCNKAQNKLRPRAMVRPGPAPTDPAATASGGDRALIPASTASGYVDLLPTSMVPAATAPG